MSTSKHQRKLSNFLIDRPYQLRYTLSLILICGVLCGIMGSYWYQEMLTAEQVVEVGVISTMREGDARRVHDELVSDRHTRLAIMAAGGAMLCLVVGVFSLVLTHGVAGPLYVIKRSMAQIREGQFPHLRPLRKGDSLTDFYAVFHSMTDALKEQAALDLKQIDAAIAALEGEEGEAQTVLAELRERKAKLLSEG